MPGSGLSTQTPSGGAKGRSGGLSTQAAAAPSGKSGGLSVTSTLGHGPGSSSHKGSGLSINDGARASGGQAGRKGSGVSTRLPSAPAGKSHGGGKA